MSDQMVFELAVQDQVNRTLKIMRAVAKTTKAMRDAGASPFDVANALRFAADNIVNHDVDMDVA